MDLIFVHGPPAAGKLTIARHLQTLLPARLSDNHTSIDLAKTIFDFDAPGFWPLTHALRQTVLAAAASSDLEFLISTNCYNHPDDLPMYESYEDILAKHGGKVRPVFLDCAPDILIQRVSAPDRIARGKLSDPKALKAFLEKNNNIAVPRADVRCYETSVASPLHVAQQIAKDIIQDLAEGR